MSLRLRKRGRFAAALLAIMVVAVTPGGVAATSYSATYTPYNWVLNTNAYSGVWYGSVPASALPGDFSVRRTYGTWSWTGDMGKITEASKTNDLWLVNVKLRWTQTSPFHDGKDNYGYVRLKTYTTASQAGWTDNETGNSCSSPVSLTFGMGPVSATVNPTICPNNTVVEEKGTVSQQTWHTADVAATPSWDVVYLVTVKQGVVPSFYVTVGWPFYDLSYTCLPACHAVSTRHMLEDTYLFSTTTP